MLAGALASTASVPCDLSHRRLSASARSRSWITGDTSFRMMSTELKPHPDTPDDFLWETYLTAAKDEDESRPKNWEGNTTGILTFVCI